MKTNLLRSFILFASFLFVGVAAAQRPMLIHSHNDYERKVPFYQAYAQGVYSIEVDLHYSQGKLLVGHDAEDLQPHSTFEAIYVQPLVELFKQNKGRVWRDSDEPLQLMIELKTATEPTLGAVVEVLNRYPEVFDARKNGHAVRIAITGRVPQATEFINYPTYVLFDGDLDGDYTPEQLKRIALFSANFRAYSSWNGKGSIVAPEREKIEKAIDRAHEQNKPIRFWGAPEGMTVYYTFYDMGVDYINTDRPELCAEFFSNFAQKNFQIGAKHRASSGVTGTKRLDRTTRDFKGFQNEKLHLATGVETYIPSFKSDGSKTPIHNVILLIGDGMGLSQIAAGAFANKGLTLLQMKYLGLQSTAAADAFTTDSAAAGSALATGEPHNNRHISMTADSVAIPSLSDFFHAKGHSVGVVTLGNAADATPSAFYGHSVERDDSDILTASLRDGKLDLLCGSGIREFEKRKDGLNLIKELVEKYRFIRSIDKICDAKGATICIDERMGDAAEESNIEMLAQVTRSSIAKLQERSSKGFFLMVEGAKIDYAGHSKSLPGSIIEQLSFDLAIAEALRFADNDGHTLVIVTGDHETGGLTLLDGDSSTGRVMGVYVTDDHTPIFLPVFAYGPGAQNFIGVYPNTEIPQRIRLMIK